MEGPLIILSTGGKGTSTKEGAGIKGTVRVISSDPLAKMTTPDSQRYP